MRPVACLCRDLERQSLLLWPLNQMTSRSIVANWVPFRSEDNACYPQGGGWTSLQARPNLRAIFAFHRFLTLSFLSAKVH